MHREVCRLLVQNSSFRNLIFYCYYRYLIQSAIALLRLQDSQSQPVIDRGDSFLSGRDKQASSQEVGDQTDADACTTQNLIAGLEKNFASSPVNRSSIKIMPLGDFQTSGVIGTHDRDSGGYRTELWQKFGADGLIVDFVGSQASGPDSLGAKNHEGHGSWTIEQISGSVNAWLNTYQPDFILLSIGLADTKTDSIRTMVSEFSALIDQITAQLPKADLLVASLPPIHPAQQPAKRVLRATYFNTAIPYIVNMKVAQGKKVHFVDMRSLTLNDLTSSISLDLDNGLHLNAQGYRKVASFWHDAVLVVLSNQRSYIY